MSEDLYARWLGVPPGPRPPNHYELLGLPLWTTASEQIEAAAYRQLEKLDQHSLHPDPARREACSRLMNEVAQARTVLMDVKRRKTYEKQLAAQQLAGPPEPQPATRSRPALKARTPRSKRSAAASQPRPESTPRAAGRPPARRAFAWLAAGILVGAMTTAGGVLALRPAASTEAGREVAARTSDADPAPGAEQDAEPAKPRPEASEQPPPATAPQHEQNEQDPAAAPASAEQRVVNEPDAATPVEDAAAPPPPPAVVVAALNRDLTSAFEAPSDGEREANLAEVQSAYAYHLNQALAAFEGARIAEARRHLALCPVSQRRWEWRRLRHVLDGSLRSFDIASANTARFTADGKALLVGGHYGVLRVDLRTGATATIVDAAGESRTLRGFDSTGQFVLQAVTHRQVTGSKSRHVIVHVDSGRTMTELDEQGGRFSSTPGATGGRHWLSTPPDKPAQVWNVLAGQPVAELDGSQQFSHLAFVQGDERVLGLADGSIAIWNAQTGQQVKHLPGPATDATEPVTFSDDGRHVLIGRGATVEVWDVAKGEPLDLPFPQHDADVTAIAVLQAHGLGISADAQGRVQAWNLTNGEVQNAVDLSEPVISRIAPGLRDGHVLIQTGSRQLTVWRVLENRHQKIDLPNEIHGTINAISAHANGQSFLVGTSSELLRIGRQQNDWQLQSLFRVPPTSEQIGWSQAIPRAAAVVHRVDNVTPSPSGGWTRSGSSGSGIRVFQDGQGRTRDFELPDSSAQQSTRVAVAPDGSLLAWAGLIGERRRGEGRASARRVSVSYEKYPQYAEQVRKHADPTHSRADYGIITREQWDAIRAGRPVPPSAHSEVQLIDMSTGRKVVSWFTPPELYPADSLNFSEDSRFLMALAARDDVIRLWDVQRQRHVRDFQLVPGSISTATIGPGGTYLAVAYAAKEPVHLYDVANGELVALLSGHRGRLTTLTFAADGERIAAAGSAGELYVWDVERARLTHRLRGHEGPIREIAFHPDGEQLVSVASTDTGGRVRLWSLNHPEPYPLATDLMPVTKALPERARMVALGAQGQIAFVVGPDHTAGDNDSPAQLYVGTPDASDPAVQLTLSGQLYRASNSFEQPEHPVVFSEDGERLAVLVRPPSVEQERTSPLPVLEVYDLDRATRLRQITLPADTKGNDRPYLRITPQIALSPDSQLVLVDGGGTLRVWEVETGADVYERERRLSLRFAPARFAPDGRSIIFQDTPRNLVSYELASQQRRTVFAADDIRVLPSAFTIAPDSKHMILTSRRGGLTLIDLTGHTEPRPLDMGGQSSGFAPTQMTLPVLFSTDTSRMFARLPDRLLVWDTQNWRLMAEFDLHARTTVSAVAPRLVNDRLLAIDRAGTALEVWETSADSDGSDPVVKADE